MMTFKEIRERSGMNLTQFSQYFKIPYRTLQHWEHNTRSCPEYLLDLIQYKLKMEILGIEFPDELEEDK